MQIPIKIIDCSDLNIINKKEEVFDFVRNTSNLPFVEVDKKQGIVKWESFKQNFYPVLKRPNIYIIYHRKSQNERWLPSYVGQRKSKGILQRLNNHLNNCSKDTGSKRHLIKEVIGNDEYISLKVIRVEPETLRTYFEEELIKEFRDSLIWNIQS